MLWTRLVGPSDSCFGVRHNNNFTSGKQFKIQNANWGHQPTGTIAQSKLRIELQKLYLSHLFSHEQHKSWNKSPGFQTWEQETGTKWKDVSNEVNHDLSLKESKIEKVLKYFQTNADFLKTEEMSTHGKWSLERRPPSPLDSDRVNSASLSLRPVPGVPRSFVVFFRRRGTTGICDVTSVYFSTLGAHWPNGNSLIPLDQSRATITSRQSMPKTREV